MHLFTSMNFCVLRLTKERRSFTLKRMEKLPFMEKLNQLGMRIVIVLPGALDRLVKEDELETMK